MEDKTTLTDITSRLDELTVLLEKQLDCIRKSEFSSFEQLTSQTELLIESVCQRRGSLQKTEHKQKLARIQRLYNTIILAIRSQTEELSQRLKHLRKGRETLSRYQGFNEKSA